MSFNPHHPGLIPGMPPLPPSMAPGMVPPGFHFPPIAPMMQMGMMPRPMMSHGMPSAQMPDNRIMNPRGQIVRKPAIIQRRLEEIQPLQVNQGPTITVFVGNITERAADNLVKQLLMKCGNMVSWKRVQGASGKLQAFGFCEYGDPESALRAIRTLHEWELGEKKLVVKVDAKTKEQLDEYKANKRRSRFDIDAAGSKTPTESERDDEDELDEETKKEDSIVRTGIQVLLKDYEYELTRSMLPSDLRKKARQEKAEEDKEAKDNLDEMDLEEDKKNLIHREIDKFRDQMKKLEEEKEKEKERREKERERRDRERGERDHHRRERTDGGGGGGGMSNRLHGGRSPDRSNRTREHLTNNRSRSKSREREREREKERDRDMFPTAREKELDRDKREKDKEMEREEEEDAYERRKVERKLREKDLAYRDRLRNWEARERKKSREYEKYKEKEDEKRNEEMKEARRLKEFLEDYDDERDDSKYYKSNALLRRLKDREKEMEADQRDRTKEKEELEELRLKLMEEGHPDPSAEMERIRKETEEKFKPLVKAEVKTNNSTPPVITLDGERGDRERSGGRRRGDESRVPHAHSQAPPNTKDRERDRDRDRGSGLPNLNIKGENHKHSSHKTENREDQAPSGKPPKLIGFSNLNKLGALSPGQSQSSSGSSSVPAPVPALSRKKKLTVGDVFNMDEDESLDGQPKRRKLVPLDYTEDEKKAVNQSGGSGSQEEKRKNIKNLIEKIPTEKEKLFEYVIDWNLVDSVLMERRIKPWINKKIVEYIGEEEPTLVDFICSKLMVGSMPQSILDDVQMVLDDEAEVFVVKMWRLLIYEIEAKKLGLVK